VSEVVVHVLRKEPILKAVDDVFIGDVGDGGAHLEETLGVEPQGLVHLLLDLGQIRVNACSDHGSLEVVDKGPLKVLPGVMEFVLRLSSQVRGEDSKATGK
jgi:hypothetical protein